MTPQEKLAAQLDDICAKAKALPAEITADAIRELGETQRRLNRLAKRAGGLPEEFELVSIDPHLSAPLRFAGRKIAEARYETRGRGAAQVALDLWQTESGAYVAAVDARAVDGGFEEIQATVVEIGEPDPGCPWVIRVPTEEARQWHVMDAFAWEARAMKMLSRGLGWRIPQEIA